MIFTLEKHDISGKKNTTTIKIIKFNNNNKKIQHDISTLISSLIDAYKVSIRKREWTCES